MNHAVVPYLASPKKKSELHLIKKRQANGRIVSGQLVSKDGTEAFKVVAGIPLLQPNARLYAGPENLCEISTSKGLKPVTTRRIAPSGGHARVLFVFELIGN